MSLPEHTHLRVRSVEGVAVVNLVDAEIIYEETVVHALGGELSDLLERQGLPSCCSTSMGCVTSPAR